MSVSFAIQSGDAWTRESSAVAVSNLAGQSPHIRVQVQRDGKWQRFASFRESTGACECAAQLRKAGHLVRLISFSIAPAAG